MTFTSYAQNFEDVMLWRALKHIDHGCYVDVGAQHPVIDSVSKAFYEHGWRGTHIEPVPQYAELLRKDRPDETVLQIALADVEGTIELNVIPETGLSTAVDAYAKRHQEERLFGSQQITVSAMPLKSALRSLEGKAVHWLKIDVEGFETQVLKGWDSQLLRPWVMVVEATIPGSAETDYAAWDEIIVAANYQFVYFDGLNRFYIAREHAELAAAFLSPPNVFDDIKLTGNSSLCSELIAAHHARMLQDAGQIARAEARAAQATTHAAQIEAQAAQAAAHAAQIEAQLRDMLNSSSWRITAPLRNWVSVLRKIKFALKTGTLVPAIKRRIKNRRSLPEAAVEQKPHNLSPRAERIYTELKNAAELEKNKCEENKCAS
ncbi:MAG TPA: FkbM family methyltransferase [Gallionellaceae bacterium]|nr:FkbM family methyltransferase [Gallionellaceae bacterium]